MTTLQAGPLRLELDAGGCLRGLAVGESPLLAPGRCPPLLRIVAAGQVEAPAALTHDPAAGTLTLQFPSAAVLLHAQDRPTHLALRVREVSGPVQALLWGPIPLRTGEEIGETIGVVRGGGLAVGLQGLDVDTMGGWPAAHAAQGCPGEWPRPGARDPYEECAAWGTPWGSVLQAWRAAPGGGIALFGCAAGEALQAIGAIERAEGLPHPTLGGVWAKTSPAATAAYLICGFSEDELDEALDHAARAGLGYLYHPDPFESWGHYRPRGGDAALARCARRAAARGIGLGVHTLSNFLSTSDAYVTPRPDPRLQRTGESRLAAAAGPADTELAVLDAAPFGARGWLSTVLVGEELIRYAGVADGPPRLLGCERGAFGTAAAGHAAGSPAGKLADHGYRVFFPNAELQDEIADRLGTLLRETGVRQISFDGLEGCRETGRGTAAEARFVQGAFLGWPHEVVSDASRLGHFTWHAHTRMNWGEPWGAAMREGQTEYRFANQAYFERNLFPRMLGWFLMRLDSPGDPATTPDDIEWMLARAAGYDAGFALVADLAALRGNGHTPAILEAVRQWEAARRDGAFSAEQRARLRAGGEWHLEAEAGAWRLWPLALSAAYSCRPGARQPGQPGGADWQLTNPHGAQPLQFRLRAVGGSVRDPGFAAAGRSLILRCRLEPGESLLQEGGQAAVCDANGNHLRSAAVEGALLLQAGAQAIAFSAELEGAAEVRFLTRGAPERVAPR